MKDIDDCERHVTGKDNVILDFIEVNMFIYRLKYEL